jgi:hypothetical protein
MVKLGSENPAYNIGSRAFVNYHYSISARFGLRPRLSAFWLLRAGMLDKPAKQAC